MYCNPCVIRAYKTFCGLPNVGEPPAVLGVEVITALTLLSKFRYQFFEIIEALANA